MSTDYVYMLSNASRMLYVGLTNDLRRRLFEPRSKLINGAAIRREKQVKGWG